MRPDLNSAQVQLRRTFNEVSKCWVWLWRVVDERGRVIRSCPWQELTEENARAQALNWIASEAEQWQ